MSGKLIKFYRKNTTMSQRELASRLGVNYTYISKIENESYEVLPSIDLLTRMAHELNISPDIVLDSFGKLDCDTLQDIAQDNPIAAQALRRIHKLEKWQWERVLSIVMETIED